MNRDSFLHAATHWTNMTELTLAQVPTTSISTLSALVKLRYLNLDYSQLIRALTPISHCTLLEILSLRDMHEEATRYIPFTATLGALRSLDLFGYWYHDGSQLDVQPLRQCPSLRFLNLP